MARFANEIRAAFVCVALLGLAGPSARADMILQQYEFQGQPGTETSYAPTFVSPSLSGLNFTESGVTPGAGTNSIASSGWTNANAYYQFGFTIAAGESVTVDQLILTSRSSGTGPGFVNVLASVDGGAYTTVASITQTSTNYNDELLALTPVTATQSLTFRIVAANQTSAAGGTIGSTGTFRVGDYDPTGAPAPTPFTINGTITPTAVPEPASIAMTCFGGLCVAAVALGRKARRAR